MTNIDGIDYKVTSKSEFEQIKKSIKTNQIKDSEKSLFIEELEKIKTEIAQIDKIYYPDLSFHETGDCYIQRKSVAEVIDNKISELKENRNDM